MFSFGSMFILAPVHDQFRVQGQTPFPLLVSTNMQTSVHTGRNENAHCHQTWFSSWEL